MKCNFTNTLVEAYLNNGDISKTIEILKPDIEKQFPGIQINDKVVILPINNTNYKLKLAIINIETDSIYEDEEQENSTNTQDNLNINPELLNSLQTVANSNNPALANNAKKTLNSLSNNIASLGNAINNKTNKIINNI